MPGTLPTFIKPRVKLPHTSRHPVPHHPHSTHTQMSCANQNYKNSAYTFTLAHTHIAHRPAIDEPVASDKESKISVTRKD